MHKSYALDILQRLQHKAEKDADKEALAIAINAVKESLENERKRRQLF